MKKGFTLIELLAVIVILAIIALIAVPIVRKIIKDADESALLRSAEMYLKGVEQSIVKKSMAIGSSYNPDICEIQENGNLLCDGTDILEVAVKGKKPSSGRLIFEEGKTTEVLLTLENKTAAKNNKGEIVYVKHLADYIKDIYSETTIAAVNNIEYSLDETHSLMNDRLGSKEVAKTDGNIRYYGASPNNYIDIGDRDSDGNIIFWRIIGLFRDIEVTDEDGNVTKTEDLVKIVRADKLTSGDVTGFSWNYTSAGAGDNNWNNSSLQLMLNDEVNGYYSSGTTSYYNGSTTPITLNFSSTGLSSKARSKVERVKWNLGGIRAAKSYVDSIYYTERVKNSWSGKIALMYASDYGYAADLSSCKSTMYEYSAVGCKTVNWIYDSTIVQWPLDHHFWNTTSMYRLASSGRVQMDGPSTVNAVRPVLYLKSDVSVVEEKETNEGLKYLVVK